MTNVDILVLSDEDIHDLASGLEISISHKDGKGKMLIMSKMRYLTKYDSNDSEEL